MRRRRRPSLLLPSAEESVVSAAEREAQRLRMQYFGSKDETKNFSIEIPSQTFCVLPNLAAGARDILRGAGIGVCMADSPFSDIDIDRFVVVAPTLEKAEVLAKKLVEKMWQDQGSLYAFGAKTHTRISVKALLRVAEGWQALVVTTSEWATAMLAGGFCDDTKLVRILKITTPGHIAVVLWWPETNKAELFDSGGRHSRLYIVVDVLTKRLPPGTEIEVVNEVSLQTKEDRSCQTWIWYYLLERLVRRRSAREILLELHGMSVQERYDVVRRMWDHLLSPGLPSTQ